MKLQEAIDEVKRGLEFGVSSGKDGVTRNRMAQECLIEFATRYQQASKVKDKRIEELENLNDRLVTKCISDKNSKFSYSFDEDMLLRNAKLIDEIKRLREETDKAIAEEKAKWTESTWCVDEGKRNPFGVGVAAGIEAIEHRFDEIKKRIDNGE